MERSRAGARRADGRQGRAPSPPCEQPRAHEVQGHARGRRRLHRRQVPRRGRGPRREPTRRRDRSRHAHDYRRAPRLQDEDRRYHRAHRRPGGRRHGAREITPAADAAEERRGPGKPGPFCCLWTAATSEELRCRLIDRAVAAPQGYSSWRSRALHGPFAFAGHGAKATMAVRRARAPMSFPGAPHAERRWTACRRSTAPAVLVVRASAQQVRFHSLPPASSLASPTGFNRSSGSLRSTSAARTRSGFIDCCSDAASGSWRLLTLGKSRLSSSRRSISLAAFCSVKSVTFRSKCSLCSASLASLFCLVRTTVAVNNAPRPTIPCSQGNGAGSNSAMPSRCNTALATIQSATKTRMKPRKTGCPTKLLMRSRIRCERLIFCSSRV